MTKDKKIMNEAEIERTIRRLASEILEANEGGKDLVFVGIIARGVSLAQRIAKLIQETEKKKVPVGGLDVALYRDDLSQRGKYITVRKSHIPCSIDDKTVVLVDDVIFHGRTIRAAMDGLKDYGRAGKVQLVVLIDRGHRELPIQPDFVGKHLPTARKEAVKVHLLENEGVDEVILQ